MNHIKKSKNKHTYKFLIIFFAGLLLFFPEPALLGAKSGLLLWFNTILPTLLPFMIISNLLIKTQMTNLLGKIFYPGFRLIFKVSPNGCFPILIGFLSGIPVGANTIASLVEREEVSLNEGQYLLSFCNNASPMFIMSFVSISQLGTPSLRFYLLFIIFISGFITGTLYFRIGNKFLNSNYIGHSSKETYKLRIEELFIVGLDNEELDIEELRSEHLQEDKPISFDFSMVDESIMASLEVITKVGAYIMLFSIPAQIIASSPSIHQYIKIILISLLEVTIGINYISTTRLSLKFKIILIMVTTAFGGLSALAQTNSVINKTRLSISTYLSNKIIQTLITLILVTAMVYLL